MACVFCESEQMKPEFWDTFADNFDTAANPYYVTVRGHVLLEIGFRTRLYPPDIVAQWRRDGGLCFQGKFVPWADITFISWTPRVDRKDLEEIEK